MEKKLNDKLSDYENGLEYERVGDYILPCLETLVRPRMGRFGMMRHQYLREHHRGVFDGMLLAGTLNAHLEEIDRQANDMRERLIAQMAKAEGVTEKLKAEDQMAWIGAMNNIRSRAMEIVYAEPVFT